MTTNVTTTGAITDVTTDMTTDVTLDMATGTTTDVATDMTVGDVARPVASTSDATIVQLVRATKTPMTSLRVPSRETSPDAQRGAGRRMQRLTEDARVIDSRQQVLHHN